MQIAAIPTFFVTLFMLVAVLSSIVVADNSIHENPIYQLSRQRRRHFERDNKARLPRDLPSSSASADISNEERSSNDDPTTDEPRAPTDSDPAFHPASFRSARSGTPPSLFSGSSSIPFGKFQSLAQSMQRGNLHTVGSGSAALRVQSGPSFPINQGSSIRSTIFTQWQNLKKGAAFVFTADMDIDCDGIDYRCPGNTDGQPQTTYGALSAYSVPWIVIPDSFVSQHSSRLPGNNVAAVLCNGKLFYGILGDTNGDSPEVTGEASYLLGRSCFPSDNLNGGKGHGSADVTYIVFLGQDAVLPPSAINKNYITDFGKLRSMGDSLMKALVNNAGI